jgi:hypothetical protein
VFDEAYSVLGRTGKGAAVARLHLADVHVTDDVVVDGHVLADEVPAPDNGKMVVNIRQLRGKSSTSGQHVRYFFRMSDD